MSILIKGITLDDFIRYGGEYAGYLDGIGCTVELPDHGDLIDRDALIESAGLCVSDFGTPDERWRPDRDWYIGINKQSAVIPAERSEE